MLHALLHKGRSVLPRESFFSVYLRVLQNKTISQ